MSMTNVCMLIRLYRVNSFVVGSTLFHSFSLYTLFCNAAGATFLSFTVAAQTTCKAVHQAANYGKEAEECRVHTTCLHCLYERSVSNTREHGVQDVCISYGALHFPWQGLVSQATCSCLCMT